jgi:ParB-like chromosome segregation protein Spo0J
MIIHANYSELVNIKDLTPHPKNPNSHSDEQIERLAIILRYQGIRAPIVVSRRSGCIVAGHGRLEAIKALNKQFPDESWDKVPVSYQDFENEEQEYLYLVSDNAIAEWSELDLGKINVDILDIGPIDMELTGLKDFEVEPSEKKKKTKVCPHCGEEI